MKKNEEKNNTIINEKIVKYLYNNIGVIVNESTVFFKDLDLIGNDADEFILGFAKYFEVDMMGFKFDDYFLEEYNIPFLYWVQRIFYKERLEKKTFNLSHLEKIVNNRKWIDPVDPDISH